MELKVGMLHFLTTLKEVEVLISGQDGGVGEYTVPPRATKRRTTTNLKTKTNQNCQKIELYGSPTTKELKKHSSRPVGGVKTGSRGREDSQQGGGWWSRRSHIRVQINWEEQLGSETDCATQGSSPGKLNSQKLWLKTPVGVEAAGETPSLTGEFVGETHRVLECTQTHPPGNQHQKGPLCLWVAGEGTESEQRAEQVALFPLGLLPHRQCHNTATWVVPPRHIPKPPPFTM